MSRAVHGVARFIPSSRGRMVVLQPPDENTIESVLKKNGQVIDRWTRTLQAGGQALLIAQHGVRPDGQPFCNCGIYRRVQQSCDGSIEP